MTMKTINFPEEFNNFCMKKPLQRNFSKAYKFL